MILTIELSEEARALIERHEKTAQGAGRAMTEALHTAVHVGAQEIRQALYQSGYGLTMRHPGQGGLAWSMEGWMISEDLAALGVPSNTPAARYAAILEFGGTITPKQARALAVPVSEEAKKSAGPRTMAGLQFIPREGKPPLLARVMRGGRLQVHWVLLASVTIPGRHWLALSAGNAKGAMERAFEGRLNEYVGEWGRG
jgi:hypothetical protein